MKLPTNWNVVRALRAKRLRREAADKELCRIRKARRALIEH
jgi:hypothetical protein